MKKLQILITLLLSITVIAGCSSTKPISDESMIDPPTYFEDEDSQDSFEEPEQKEAYHLVNQTIVSNKNGEFLVIGLYQDERGDQHKGLFILDSSGNVKTQIGKGEDYYLPSDDIEFSHAGTLKLQVQNPEYGKEGRSEFLEGIMKSDGTWLIEPLYPYVQILGDGYFYTAKDHEYDDFGSLGYDFLVFNKEGNLIYNFERESDEQYSDYPIATKDIIHVGFYLFNQSGESIDIGSSYTFDAHHDYLLFSNSDGRSIYDKDFTEYTLNASDDTTRLGTKYRVEIIGVSKSGIFPINSNDMVSTVNGESYIRKNDTVINLETGELLAINNDGTTTVLAKYPNIMPYSSTEDALVAYSERENGTAGYIILLNDKGEVILDESSRLVDIDEFGIAKDIDDKQYILDFKTTTLTPIETVEDRLNDFLNK